MSQKVEKFSPRASPKSQETRTRWGQTQVLSLFYIGSPALVDKIGAEGRQKESCVKTSCPLFHSLSKETQIAQRRRLDAMYFESPKNTFDSQDLTPFSVANIQECYGLLLAQLKNYLTGT